MAVYLDVPFEEKDEAKALGARWDRDAKRWFVPNDKDAAPFLKWMPPEPETIYLVIGRHDCWKCGKSTEVAGFGIPYSLSDDEEDAEEKERAIEEFEDSGHRWFDTTHADELSIVGNLGCVPAELRDYLQERCGYKVAYSNSVKRSYLANTCTNCGALQGHFPLFEEIDSPFYVDSMKKLEALEFIRVEVEGVYGVLNVWSTNDDVVYDYALKHHEDFSERLTECIYL